MSYKADRRIYLNSAGQVCAEDDPDCASLLLAEGQSMSLTDARKYGLVQDDKPEPDAPTEGKAVADVPADKAIDAPAGNKALTHASRKHDETERQAER